MDVLPDFGAATVDNVGNISEGTEDLLYGIFLANQRINIFQIVVSTLLFLTVVAWVQLFFIQLENIDSVVITDDENVDVSAENSARRKSRQLKFATILSIITISMYILYDRVIVKK